MVVVQEIDSCNGKIEDLLGLAVQARGAVLDSALRLRQGGTGCLDCQILLEMHFS